MKVKPTDALSCMLNVCVCSGTSGAGHRGGHCSMFVVFVVLFSTITSIFSCITSIHPFIQEKAAGSTSLGFFLLLLWKPDEVFIPLKRKVS